MSAPDDYNRPPSPAGFRWRLAVIRMWWHFPGAKVPLMLTGAALLGVFLLLANPYADEVTFDTRGHTATAQVTWVSHSSYSETAYLHYQPQGSTTGVDANLTSGWRHFERGERMPIDYDTANPQRVRVAGDRVGLVAETAWITVSALIIALAHRRRVRRALARANPAPMSST